MKLQTAKTVQRKLDHRSVKKKLNADTKINYVLEQLITFIVNIMHEQKLCGFCGAI